MAQTAQQVVVVAGIVVLAVVLSRIVFEPLVL